MVEWSLLATEQGCPLVEDELDKYVLLQRCHMLLVLLQKTLCRSIITLLQKLPHQLIKIRCNGVFADHERFLAPLKWLSAQKARYLGFR